MNNPGYTILLLAILMSSFLNGQSSNGMRFNFAAPILEGAMVDDRDGTLYRTIKIGNKRWFSENLKYDTPNSLCYQKKKKNCEDLGRLYPSSDLPMACPAGWRIPTLDDWEDLKDHLGPDRTYGLLDTLGWAKAIHHTNSLGLSLKGVGYQKDKKQFIGRGNSLTLWLNGVNKFGEPYHVHIYGDKGVYFKMTDLQTNEVFHAHPMPNIEEHRYTIRCVCEDPGY